MMMPLRSVLPFSIALFILLGLSARDAIAAETPAAAATIPGAPQNLQSSPGNTQNFLGWQAPSSNGGAAITSYRVLCGTTSANQQLFTSGGCANLSAVFSCTMSTHLLKPRLEGRCLVESLTCLEELWGTTSRPDARYAGLEVV